MATKIATPVSYGFYIALFGMFGIPSSLFVVALTFDDTSWRSGIDSTGFSEVLFYWAVIHLVISGYLIIGGIKMIKNTEIIQKCDKCNQLIQHCICPNN